MKNFQPPPHPTPFNTLDTSSHSNSSFSCVLLQFVVGSRVPTCAIGGLSRYYISSTSIGFARDSMVDNSRIMIHLLFNKSRLLYNRRIKLGDDTMSYFCMKAMVVTHAKLHDHDVYHDQRLISA